MLGLKSARMLAVLSFVCLVSSPLIGAEKKVESERETSEALAFDVNTLGGKKINLGETYEDQVLLVVNVASECGLTPQYEQLQELHEKYSKKGLAILGFPCNQFGKQEPGTSDEIQSFCKENYGVEFDMFEKIDVNGDDAHAFYKYLTKLDLKPKGAGDVSWNFEKFLVDRAGTVIARFEPRTKPNDPKVISKIESSLK